MTDQDVSSTPERSTTSERSTTPEQPTAPEALADQPEPRSAWDYPRHWIADVLASDGGVVHLRPIVPDDADRIVAFHSKLSERTRYIIVFKPGSADERLAYLERDGFYSPPYWGPGGWLAVPISVVRCS